MEKDKKENLSYIFRMHVVFNAILLHVKFAVRFFGSLYVYFLAVFRLLGLLWINLPLIVAAIYFLRNAG